MEMSYIVLEAYFENPESVEYVRTHWNVSAVNITQCYGPEYRGNPMYMFVGKELDLVKYLVHGYEVQDLEELKDYLVDIKSIEF